MGNDQLFHQSGGGIAEAVRRIDYSSGIEKFKDAGQAYWDGQNTAKPTTLQPEY